MLNTTASITRIVSFLVILAFSSCTKGDFASTDRTAASAGVTPGSGTANTGAGVMTAGEWNDFDNWSFWQNLMANDTFKRHQNTWEFNCNEKWEFVVTDMNNTPVADAVIIITSGSTPLWKGRTNKFGKLHVLPGVFSTQQPGALAYTVVVNDQQQSQGSLTHSTPLVNVQLALPVTGNKNVDIMLVVDATGSMGDEIEYLKKELFDVLNRADNELPGMLRFSGIFYRDLTDSYVTKEKAFTTDKTAMVNFVKEQSAGGGGDYPEAVEEALKVALAQDWSSAAKARILFLILDAPPHKDKQKMDVVRQKVKEAAAKGIMIIPVTASGIDKETEFLMRFIAEATNSTYTFITGHSGIGGPHITPTVGNYQVEYLNNLMVRLIIKYGGM